MERILRARKNLRKNRKKGFTLVELIVVILIIAILAAALTPAILGVIDRANESADTALARSFIIAGTSAALTSANAIGSQPNPQDIVEQLEPSNFDNATWRVFFDGSIAIGAFVMDKSKEGVWVGVTAETIGDYAEVNSDGLSSGG